MSYGGKLNSTGGNSIYQMNYGYVTIREKHFDETVTVLKPPILLIQWQRSAFKDKQLKDFHHC